MMVSGYSSPNRSLHPLLVFVCLTRAAATADPIYSFAKLQTAPLDDVVTAAAFLPRDPTQPSYIGGNYAIAAIGAQTSGGVMFLKLAKVGGHWNYHSHLASSPAPSIPSPVRSLSWLPAPPYSGGDHYLAAGRPSSKNGSFCIYRVDPVNFSSTMVLELDPSDLGIGPDSQLGFAVSFRERIDGREGVVLGVSAQTDLHCEDCGSIHIVRLPAGMRFTGALPITHPTGEVALTKVDIQNGWGNGNGIAFLPRRGTGFSNDPGDHFFYGTALLKFTDDTYRSVTLVYLIPTWLTASHRVGDSVRALPPMPIGMVDEGQLAAVLWIIVTAYRSNGGGLKDSGSAYILGLDLASARSESGSWGLKRTLLVENGNGVPGLGEGDWFGYDSTLMPMVCGEEDTEGFTAGILSRTPYGLHISGVKGALTAPEPWQLEACPTRTSTPSLTGTDIPEPTPTAVPTRSATPTPSPTPTPTAQLPTSGAEREAATKPTDGAGGGGLPLALVFAIIVGGAAILCLAVCVGICMCRRKRRQKIYTSTDSVEVERVFTAVEVPKGSRRQKRSDRTEVFENDGQVMAELQIPSSSGGKSLEEALQHVGERLGLWDKWGPLFPEVMAVAEDRARHTGRHLLQMIDDREMAAAITIYTYECDQLCCDDQIYTRLTRCLRSRRPNEVSYWEPFLYYLLNGMERIQNYEGELYRGVGREVKNSNRYVAMSTVMWTTMSSTSNQKESAKDFLYGSLECGGVGTFFTIKTKKAKGIVPLSVYAEEGEYLLPINSKFTVTDRREVKEDLPGGRGVVTVIYIDLVHTTGEQVYG